nr:hypothetical protein CFP56_20489 [Quercus suber]
MTGISADGSILLWASATGRFSASSESEYTAYVVVNANFTICSCTVTPLDEVKLRQSSAWLGHGATRTCISPLPGFPSRSCMDIATSFAQEKILADLLACKGPCRMLKTSARDPLAHVHAVGSFACTLKTQSSVPLSQRVHFRVSRDLGCHSLCRYSSDDLQLFLHRYRADVSRSFGRICARYAISGSAGHRF